VLLAAGADADGEGAANSAIAAEDAPAAAAAAGAAGAEAADKAAAARPLARACKVGNVEAARLLLAGGARVSAAAHFLALELSLSGDEGGDASTLGSAIAGTALLAQLAAAAGAGGGGGLGAVADADGTTALHTAAQAGATDIAAQLLEQGLGVDAGCSRRLWRRVPAGEEAASGSVNAAGRRALPVGGIRPLMLAAAKGHAELVALLLERGADVNAVDDSGCGALHAAGQGGQTKTYELLVRRGASERHKNAAGEAPKLKKDPENCTIC
jgi:hypothetical protein